MIKVENLLDQNLITKLSENSFSCSVCNIDRTFTKKGIPYHYFYEHDETGKVVKERLRKIATEQNNDPEMKKKISKNTKKAFEREEVRVNHLNGVRSNIYKSKRSKRSKELWENDDYRKKTTDSITKNHRTPEFRSEMSLIITKTHNDPNSTVKSDWFRKISKEGALNSWKDPEEREKRCNSMKRSWEDEDRRHDASFRALEMWKDPHHVEIVIKGKIRFLKKQNKSLGKCGITKNGTYYESTFERDVYSFLEERNIVFEPHKTIPDSSKICDLVIDDIWVELDGLGRSRFDFESEFSWNGKIEHYKNLKNLKTIKDYKVFLNTNDFILWIDEDNNPNG